MGEQWAKKGERTEDSGIAWYNNSMIKLQVNKTRNKFEKSLCEGEKVK